MSQPQLPFQQKPRKLKPWRRRARRPLVVEAVPAKEVPPDCVRRFRSAHAVFAADMIRDLIDRGVYEVVDGKLRLKEPSA